MKSNKTETIENLPKESIKSNNRLSKDRGETELDRLIRDSKFNKSNLAFALLMFSLFVALVKMGLSYRDQFKGSYASTPIPQKMSSQELDKFKEKIKQTDFVNPNAKQLILNSLEKNDTK